MSTPEHDPAALVEALLREALEAMPGVLHRELRDELERTVTYWLETTARE